MHSRGTANRDGQGAAALYDASSQLDVVSVTRPWTSPIPGRFDRIARRIAITDAACILLALLAAHFVRFGVGWLVPSYIVTILLASPVWIAVYYGFGLYHAHQMSEWVE